MVSHPRGEHETRVTGDKAQRTMGRLKKGGEARFSFSRLPLRANSYRERDVWVQGSSWELSTVFSQEHLKTITYAKFGGQTELIRAIFVWPWNENARTKQKQQTNENRAIWLVYRTDTNARGFWLVKRTLGWKNVIPENFPEINRYFALTSYCDTIGQSNNAFSILAGKRRGHVLITNKTSN